MRMVLALLLLLLVACSSSVTGDAGKSAQPATRAPSTYQQKVIDFVAAHDTPRGVIVHLYQRYNAGNRDRSVVDVIESSEAAYEAVTLSDCVNPIVEKSHDDDLLKISAKIAKAGLTDVVIAKALAVLPKKNLSPLLANAKQPGEKRVQAALASLMNYSSDPAGDTVSRYRANAAFYYFLSAGTDGACAATPELQTLVGAPLK